MSKKRIKLDLSSAANGEVQAKVDRSLALVMQNILDPNTDPTKKRGITIQIDLTPDEERDYIEIEVSTKEKLIPRRAAKTRMLVERDSNDGQIYANELYSQVKGQVRMNLDEGKLETDIGEDIAEVEKEQSNQVVNFRQT